MIVTVNGDERRIERGTTVDELVGRLGSPTGRGVAVAVNGEVVPRGSWAQAALDEGDRVEILRAVGGG